MTSSFIKTIPLSDNKKSEYLTASVKPGGCYYSSYNRAVVNLATTEPTVSWHSDIITCDNQRQNTPKVIMATIDLGTKLQSDLEIRLDYGAPIEVYYAAATTQISLPIYIESSDTNLEVFLEVSGKSRYGTKLVYHFSFLPPFEKNCSSNIACTSNSSTATFSASSFTFPVYIRIDQQNTRMFNNMETLQAYLAENKISMNLYTIETET